MLHTILGANGVIGRELARILDAEGQLVRQVSRTPERVSRRDELVGADLLDAVATGRAVAGSDVAYLVAGLRYDTRVWRQEWPVVMRNVIQACQRNNCRLVFFDNVYAYGRVEGSMTEDTPFRPMSGKGEVRAEIARMLLDAMRAGSVNAMIVRAADFYGPGASLSLTQSVVFERLRSGKSPQWLGDPSAIHAFTYTPDAARALAVLSASEDAYGQTWHAPTSAEPMTGETFVRIACEIADRPYQLQTVPRWILKTMSLFMPILRENMEMMYQFDHDYRFDSSKIERAYGLTATPYRDGIAETLRG